MAQDFKKKGDNNREDLFAAMPPLEAKKALFRLAAVKMTGKMTQRGEAMKLMMVDVRKAHLNAKCNRHDVYVAYRKRLRRDWECAEGFSGGCMGCEELRKDGRLSSGRS